MAVQSFDFIYAALRPIVKGLGKPLSLICFWAYLKQMGSFYNFIKVWFNSHGNKKIHTHISRIISGLKVLHQDDVFAQYIRVMGEQSATMHLAQNLMPFFFPACHNSLYQSEHILLQVDTNSKNRHRTLHSKCAFFFTCNNLSHFRCQIVYFK